VIPFVSVSTKTKGWRSWHFRSNDGQRQPPPAACRMPHAACRMPHALPCRLATALPMPNLSAFIQNGEN
jgi:hypothetical protein